MLMADQIDAAIFGAHFDSGIARVPVRVCCVFRLSTFLYVLRCSRCGLAVVRVFTWFSLINQAISFLSN
jgi:hypothetical protein